MSTETFTDVGLGIVTGGLYPAVKYGTKALTDAMTPDARPTPATPSSMVNAAIETPAASAETAASSAAASATATATAAKKRRSLSSWTLFTGGLGDPSAAPVAVKSLLGG